jgi:hypothetical protein
MDQIARALPGAESGLAERRGGQWTRGGLASAAHTGAEGTTG